MKQNPTAQERIKKTTQKTTQKIITFLHINPDATRKDIAVEAGITEDGVKYHLAKLQKQGLIRRVGPDKGGRCEILEPDLRWFPADEALRESSYDRLLPPRVHKSLQEIKAWMRKILKSTNPALSGV